jgi:HEAT repeat protein
MLTAEQAQLRFQRTVTLLRDPEAPFTAEAIYSLSDLTGEHLETFRALWPDLPAERRRDLIRRLVETAETNFELDFSAIVEPALQDPDHEVRLAAVEGVLEDASLSTIRQLMRIAKGDAFEPVRASAVKALGPFVLRGELGKLPDRFNTDLQDLVLALHNDVNEDFHVRRRALEAISNCGREGVDELIRRGYRSNDLLMRVSAVFAMGRSCDDMWLPQIIAELSSEHTEMRYEAARAAGELELRPALAQLAELAYEDDREIQEMAIWALGEIGGKEANRILTQLAALADTTEDDELADAVAEAQAVATLSGSELLPLFDFGDYDEEDDLDDEDFLLGLDAFEDDLDEEIGEYDDQEDEEDGEDSEDGEDIFEDDYENEGGYGDTDY